MSSKKPSRIRWLLLGVSVLIYAVSFFLPAASLPGRIESFDIGGREIAGEGIKLPTMHLKGYQAFSWALKIGRIDWFANPVLWIGFLSLACRWWLAVGIAGTFSLALGLLTVLVYNSSNPELNATFFVGYWLWLASMLVVAVIGWLGHWHSKAITEPVQKTA